ncbi:uncharacterized protein LOC133203489 [Saccostrea echinata]|uniref:uncharacterized protein LOC133203489 n=1 Tax=Saccostrea echinata TaxID=191078 RepID=UPI002A80AA43|nr:uncharacterized protein LOC133203489 [Saccostrea echinata]
MDKIPDTAQHFIECDNKLCRNYSEFYCNTCYQRMCGLCREIHLKEMTNRKHHVVSFLERKRKRPSENCQIHINADLNVYCDGCQIPVCPACFAREHSDHEKSDIETVYNNILLQCQKEHTNILRTVIPNAEKHRDSFCEREENAKQEILKLRLCMKKRADALKKAAYSILAVSNEELDKIEKSILQDLKKQQKNTDDYIDDLQKIVIDYESKMSSIKLTELIEFHTNMSIVKLKMPKLTPISLPVFIPGTINKEELAKQFGEVKKESFEEKLSKTAMKLSTSFTIAVEVALPKLSEICHLSSMTSNKFWASDYRGNLIESDLKGKISQKIKINTCGVPGNHAVTKERKLIYTDTLKRAVYRASSGMVNEKIISTGNWVPEAIYSSHINGHILVGMRRQEHKRITRYNEEGRKLLDIQMDTKGQRLYQGIYYITENINGDICTSDNGKVVVVTRLGDYRFTYSGHQSQSRFDPYGICTDILGHIIVCNGSDYSNENHSSVHLLDHNGQFISFLLTPDQCPYKPCALCVDDQHNLWVGYWRSSTATVYKYLRNTNK